MSTLAALMILIACPADGSACVQEPVSVISYGDTGSCRTALSGALARAKRSDVHMYGDCIPVDPALLAGKPGVSRSMTPDEITAALSTGRQDARPSAFAPGAVANTKW